MKIALIADPYISVPPVQYGGSEQVIYYLIKGLIEAGHEPVLFGPGDSTVDCQVISTVKQALLFPKNRRGIRASTKQVEEAAQKTNRLLRKHLSDFDIIHSHGFDLLPFQDKPNITTLHNQISLDQMKYYEERRQLPFVSISKSQRRDFPSLHYVKVIYNGEDPKEFPVVTDPEDYVCFLGRLDRDKNPHLAIKLALAYGIRIKLAGKKDVGGGQYFKEEIQRYLRHPLVEYLGELNFEQKIELVSNAKCNLHPTGFREPFGLTVLESAYCGTPTLAIGRGSLPELIDSGKTGILVDDFAEGYHQLDKCFALDRKYVASRARKRFSYTNMTHQYLLAYDKVIKEFQSKDKGQKRKALQTPRDSLKLPR